MVGWPVWQICHEKLQRRKIVLDWRKRGDPITLQRECPNGHAWHMPLVIKPGIEPATCDCESVAMNAGVRTCRPSRARPRVRKSPGGFGLVTGRDTPPDPR